jgi:hypothetical protein
MSAHTVVFLGQRKAMSRGITESDVFTAADSLLVAGERPTVDRVRAVIGSGSPNTVVRHLDAWWAHAGQRLAASAQRMALPEAPEPVAALAASFWTEALMAARAETALALAGERAQLDEQHAAWEAARALDEQVRAAQAAEVAKGREDLASLTMQLKGLTDQRLGWDAERERLLLELQRAGATAEEDRRALSDARRSLAEAQQRADEERQASAIYVRSVEDRAHQAIDEGRQERKALKQSLTTAAREQARRDATHAREVVALTKTKAAAEREVARLQGRVQALETALKALKPAPRVSKKVKPGVGKPRARKASTA